MLKQTRDSLLWVIVTFIALASSYAPVFYAAEAAPTYTTWSGPPYVLLSANATTMGYFQINGTARFASYTTTATGGLGDFSRFTLNGVYEWPRIGFGCDTVNTTCTVLQLTRRQLVYQPGDVGSVFRVWSPDYGEPDTVENGDYTYDATWAVSTITPTNGAQIRVTWNVVSNIAFEGIYDYIWIVGLMPLVSSAVLLIAALSGNLSQDNYKPILGLVVSSLLVTLILYAITA